MDLGPLEATVSDLIRENNWYIPEEMNQVLQIARITSLVEIMGQAYTPIWIKETYGNFSCSSYLKIIRGKGMGWTFAKWI